LKRASTGGRTLCAMSPSKTSTIGCGRLSSSAALPISFTSKSSLPSETVRCSRGTRCRAKKRFRCSTTSLTWPLGNHRLGNPTAINLLVSIYHNICHVIIILYNYRKSTYAMLVLYSFLSFPKHYHKL